MLYYNDLQAIIQVTQQWLARNRKAKNIEVAQFTRLSTSWNPEDVGKCLLISRYEKKKKSVPGVLSILNFS